MENEYSSDEDAARNWDPINEVSDLEEQKNQSLDMSEQSVN